MKWIGTSLLKKVLSNELYSRRYPIRRNVVLYEEDIERLKPFIEEQRAYLGYPTNFKPNFSAVIRRVIKIAYEQKTMESTTINPHDITTEKDDEDEQDN